MSLPKGSPTKRSWWRETHLFTGMLATVLVGFVAGVALFNNVNPETAVLGLDPVIWIPALVFGLLAVSAVVIGRRSVVGDSSTGRPRINWFMWVYLVSVLLMYINGGAIVGGAGQAVELALPGKLGYFV